MFRYLNKGPFLTFLGLYNPTIIERLTFFGLGYSAPKEIRAP